MQRPLPACAALLLAVLAATAVQAQDLDARYTLSLRGLSGGEIVLRGRESGGGYAVNGGARATGLVGAFVSYLFEGTAQGTVSNGRHISTRYTEREDDDGEVTGSVTRFRGTTPRDVTFSPARNPEPYDIEPTAQRGVIDPLTGLYLVMRDTDPAGACSQSYDLFDGRHVSRMSLGPAQVSADGTIRCAGEYRRLAGYRPKDMADPAAPMTFVYAPLSNGQVRVVEVRSPGRLGEGVLRRQ